MKQSESVAGKKGRASAAGPIPSNALVLLAMVVVAIGLGVALRAHLAMPLWAAVSGAVAMFAGIAVSHVAFVRGQRIGELEREVARLWSAVGAPLEPATARAGGARAPADGLSGPVALNRVAGGSGAMSRPTTEVVSASKIASPQAPTSAGRETRSFGAVAATSPAPAAAVAATRSLAEETAMARALAEAAVMEEQKASSPTVEAPLVADAGRRLDASAIHELVKKLADETGAAPNVSVMSPPRTRLAGAAQPDPAVVPERIAEQDPSPDPSGSGDAITDSVRALRAAADAMRPVEAPEEMEAVDVEERLALLADALTADRIDIMLEPIIGLKDQATRHYEVSVSLRTLEGLRIDPNESRHLLDGTGILPLIDLAKISRIAEVARLLAERGKSGAVFAGFAGESLGDNDFMARFSEIYNDRTAITEQLVISLAQEDVRAFAPAHWAMIKDLGSVGFRFALEHLTDLDMDFDTLRASGIQYVKLDADIFLQGLMAGEGAMVPAEEVYSFLAGKGLSLIVDHIASETQLMRIVDCGVLYGQGQLFGGPRAVKAKVFATRSAA